MPTSTDRGTAKAIVTRMLANGSTLTLTPLDLILISDMAGVDACKYLADRSDDLAAERAFIAQRRDAAQEGWTPDQLRALASCERARADYRRSHGGVQ